MQTQSLWMAMKNVKGGDIVSFVQQADDYLFVVRPDTANKNEAQSSAEHPARSPRLAPEERLQDRSDHDRPPGGTRNPGARVSKRCDSAEPIGWSLSGLAEVLIPSAVLQQICKEIKQLGGEIEISVTPGGVDFDSALFGCQWFSRCSDRSPILHFQFSATACGCASR